MEKIIEPVSYKKMVEKFTRPAHTYGIMREGYGAGYTLTFLGIKLTNVKVEKPQKDSDGIYTARFTADVVPGDYHFFADHPMWNLGSYDGKNDKQEYLHRDWKPYIVDSWYAVQPAIVAGGKVEGVCDDGGQKFESWNSDDAKPGWTEEDYVNEIQSEQFCVEDTYGGGWAHTPMRTEIEFEAEERGNYYHGIDLGFNSNDATLTKITFQFDPDWVADYNDDVDRAIYGDDEEEEDDYYDEEDEKDEEEDWIDLVPEHESQKSRKLRFNEGEDKKGIRESNNFKMKEAAPRNIDVDFPVHVDENGLIPEEDARKILRKLAADHKLRVGSHYSIFDTSGNSTIWDFCVSKDPGFGYTFENSIVADNGISNNIFYLNKRGNRVNLKDATYVSHSSASYHNESKFTEAARYTHRIELEQDDPSIPMRVRLTHADQLKYRSQEEAQEALEDLNNRIGSRLKSKGLHLEIHEIPQKPRRVASQVEGYENPFEVGDILEGDFGYSMILPVWYEVVKVTSKQVTLKELSSIVVSHDGYGQAGRERPNIGVYKKDWEGKEKEVRALVKMHKGSWYDKYDNPKKKYYVSVNGHILDLWDGEDKNFDTYD